MPARHTTARRNCQPPLAEEQTLVSDMQWCGSLAGMHGARVPTWHLTGRRDVGEPLVRPVKASPSHCPSRRPPRSVRFGQPAARSGSSPRLQRAGRTNESLAATPSSTRQPVKAYPSETLHLVVTSPIRKSITASNFRARELPSAPGSWSRSTPSGVGLTHARGRKPVEDRPSARMIAGRLVPISQALSLSLDVLRDARDEARG
jgi:hypothetical protein